MTAISAAAHAGGAGDRTGLERSGLVAASAVWATGLVALTLEMVLSGWDTPAELARGFSLYGHLALLAYGALGTALVRARPGNRLGWVALGVAGGHALALVTGTYGLVALERGWAGAALTIWVGSWVWVAGYWLVPTFLLLLFPDGRLPSRRWWPVVAAAATGLIVSMLGWATLPYAERDVPLEVPLAQPLTLPFAGALMLVGAVLGVLSALGGLAALLVRHSRASGKERLQVRWALLGGTATVLLLGGAIASGPGFAGPMLIAVGMVPLPAALAVGVLRHRLWDVDVVINRSVVYGLLTLVVLTTYVTTVSLLGGLLGRGTGAPLVATALVAVGVNPARQRLQAWVNEVLYGQREDPYTALARLVERLDAVDGAGSALDEAAETVRRALRATHATVEVRGAVRSVAGEPPRRAEVLGVPLRVRGELIGSLRVAMPPGGGALEGGERRLLDDLGRHIALAAHTEQLTADLQASRRSLVEAREEERRRIRRDLHDGLGPTLASVAMRIEQAGHSGTTDALAGLPERVREAVRSVRSLVEDLRPAALDEIGLPAALRVQVGQFAEAGLHVDDAIEDDLGPLSAAVDVAAYRIVSEALTNVSRHAAATRCRVAVRREEDRLHLEVADDGTGLPVELRAGVGLASMRERAAEVGGTCRVETRPTGGTCVHATLPAGA